MHALVPMHGLQKLGMMYVCSLNVYVKPHLAGNLALS